MINRLRKNSLIAVVIGLLLWIPQVGFGQSSIGEIKQEAKAAKLSPDLFNLQLEAAQQPLSQKSANLRQAASSDDNLKSMKLEKSRVRDGMILIDAIANDPDGQALLSDLQALGMTEGQYYQRIVSGYFPIAKLNQLRNIATLHFARPASRGFTKAGKVTSQGDVVMKANIARQTYNVRGAGSKIGVLSDSYNALGGAAAGVASDDLPSNVQVLKDLSLQADSSVEDEGRAMAEIIHDVAPGAAIAFHTAFDGEVDYARGIRRLANAGCNIIVDDVHYLTEPFFQDGIIAQAVDYVNKNQNVSYFSSAGNDGRQSYTSGFRNSGKPAPYFPFAYGYAHDFGNGAITQKIVVQPGRSFAYSFQWNDPFYSASVAANGVSGAKTDMDVFVYYQGLLTNISSYDVNIDGDAVEWNGFTNPFPYPIEIEIALIKVVGPDPSLIKSIFSTSASTQIQYANNTSTVFGHANAKGAIAVGAAAYYQTPSYNSNSSPALNRVFVSTPNPLAEVFSSAGGTPILFTNYGQPIPPETRLKPEIVAPDGGNTTFFIPGSDLDGDGFPNFGGTSAAAPHAAAVAALLQEKAKLSMSPDDVKKRLELTADDMDDPSTPGFDIGFDFGTGYGFIQADKALMYGQPLAVVEPLYDCQTRKITLQTTGGDGSPITFTVPGVQRTPPASTTIAVASFYSPYLTRFTTYTPTSTTGIVEAGVIADNKSILITATQSGVSVTYSFNIAEYCARPRELTLIEPLYDCATGKITFRTQGGNGSPITFIAPGVMRSSATDPNGTVEAGLRYDPMPINITAIQNGVTVSYRFNFAAYCNGRARVASAEVGSGLQVSVLGNPVASDYLEVEVQGAQGQALKLQLHNTLGELSSQKAVEQAEGVERHKLSVGGVAGLYFLQVSTPQQTKTIKVIRQ